MYVRILNRYYQVILDIPRVKMEEFGEILQDNLDIIADSDKNKEFLLGDSEKIFIGYRDDKKQEIHITMTCSLENFIVLN